MFVKSLPRMARIHLAALAMKLVVIELSIQLCRAIMKDGEASMGVIFMRNSPFGMMCPLIVGIDLPRNAKFLAWVCGLIQDFLKFEHDNIGFQWDCIWPLQLLCLFTSFLKCRLQLDLRPRMRCIWLHRTLVGKGKVFQV